MFNNPFDSFHNTVSEAKNEREQLGQLLTISTPRERLLLVLLTTLMLALGSWLVFGVVVQTWSIEGVVSRQDNDHDVYFLNVDLYGEGIEISSKFRTGMSAVVNIDLEGEGSHAVEGNVHAVVLKPVIVPEAETFPGSNPANWVEITLDEKPEPASILGRDCTVVVELDRQSPLAFFASRLL
ncbi:MAG: hypothetical protein F4X44_04030 [Gammaproteobacteria bacterium]|nr:hypothetical protein [Gammaproteobacteria bacterium]MYD79765.1 hypothetical protein [Gammaproteobacteria bacterium]